MPSNVPPFDPGAFVLPGATAVSEAGVWFDGFIGTCVEAATTVVGALYGLWPATQATDKSIAQSWINAGTASPQGYSNWSVASAYLTAQGVPNYAQGTADNWQALTEAALAKGEPVLLGFWDPGGKHAPIDTWTGTAWDAGVEGHAVTVVGEDATGFIVADPNSGPASTGGFVHYMAADLDKVASSLVIPDAPPAGATPLSFTGGNPPNGPSPWQDVGAALGGVLGQTGAGAGLGGLGGAAAQDIAKGIKNPWDTLTALVTNVMESGAFISLGIGLILLGLLAFFFVGNVGGKAPVEHAARGARLAAAAG